MMYLDRTSVFFPLSICLFCLLTGCASIMTGGGQEELFFQTEPPGAEVVLRGGPHEIRLVTPASVMLDKKFGYMADVRKKGYKDMHVEIARSGSGWVWGNLLIGGIIGLYIDTQTGATGKFEKKHHQIKLEPLPTVVKTPERTRDAGGDSAVELALKEYGGIDKQHSNAVKPAAADRNLSLREQRRLVAQESYEKRKMEARRLLRLEEQGSTTSTSNLGV